MILDRESPWSVSLIMTDAGVTRQAELVVAKDESMFTPEHLTLPGLYSEVMTDDMEGDEEADTGEEADNDTDSCYCESCSSPSPIPSITLSRFELSCIYHRFISSLRIAPVFRNFQVSDKNNRDSLLAIIYANRSSVNLVKFSKVSRAEDV